MSKTNRTPIYRYIANSLQQEIRIGKYKTNELLPSENELSEIYNASRPTIRQALNELRTKNYIYTERGKGSFVSSLGYYGDIENGSFTDQFKKFGFKIYSKVLQFNKMNKMPEIFQKYEKLSEKEEFSDGSYYLKRIRFVEDLPISIQETILPSRFYPKLLMVDFSCRSLYEELQNQYDVEPNLSDMVLTPTLASESEANLLGISMLDPLLESWAIVYRENGQIMESTHSLDINKFGFRVRYSYDSVFRTS